MTFYAHMEDFVEAFIGPFETAAQADAHAAMCKARGDGATYHGAVTELPEDAFVIDPASDEMVES